MRAGRSTCVARNRDCLPLRYGVASVDQYAVGLDVEVPAREAARVTQPDRVPPVLKAPIREWHVPRPRRLGRVVRRGQILLEPLDGACAGGADLRSCW